MKNQSMDNQPATKSDLADLEVRLEKRFEKKFATKSDLADLEVRLEKRFEKKFATKSELKRVEKSLRREILRLEEKVENLEDKMNLQYNDVMTKLDKMTGILERLDIDREIGADQTQELREQVDNHEKRIAKLEGSN